MYHVATLTCETPTDHHTDYFGGSWHHGRDDDVGDDYDLDDYDNYDNKHAITMCRNFE